MHFYPKKLARSATKAPKVKNRFKKNKGLEWKAQKELRRLIETNSFYWGDLGYNIRWNQQNKKANKDGAKI